MADWIVQPKNFTEKNWCVVRRQCVDSITSTLATSVEKYGVLSLGLVIETARKIFGLDLKIETQWKLIFVSVLRL